MAPAGDRNCKRRDQRHRAAAARTDLLSHPCARTVRRRAARRSRRGAATGDHAISRSETADDRAGRRRHAVAGDPRTAQRLDRTGRRAGAFCRPPTGAGRRRPGAGEAAARRTQPRRQSDLGKAAASGRLRSRRSVRGPCGAQGRHRQPASARRTRCRARDQELGLAGRWYAAGDGRAPRQGDGQPVSCQRRYALVGSAVVGHLRRDAAADCRHVRLYLQSGCRRRNAIERGNRGAVAHPRRVRRVRAAACHRKAVIGRFPRPRDAGSSAWFLRPGGRTAGRECIGGSRSHRAARYLAAQGKAGELHQCRAARSQGHPAVGVTRAIPDRCDHRRTARRRPRRAVAAARRPGGLGACPHPYRDDGSALATPRRGRRKQ